MSSELQRDAAYSRSSLKGAGESEQALNRSDPKNLIPTPAATARPLATVRIESTNRGVVSANVPHGQSDLKNTAKPSATATDVTTFRNRATFNEKHAFAYPFAERTAAAGEPVAANNEPAAADVTAVAAAAAAKAAAEQAVIAAAEAFKAAAEALAAADAAKKAGVLSSVSMSDSAEAQQERPALQETNVVAAASDGPAAAGGERDVVNDAHAGVATPDAAATPAAAEADTTDAATPSAIATDVTTSRNRATLNEDDAFADALAESTAATVATPPEPSTTEEGWLNDLFPQKWKDFLGTGAVSSVLTKVEAELKKAENCPYHPKTDIFNAFWACEPDKVKVVFLALDPAPERGEANGLALSAPAATKIKNGESTSLISNLTIKCFLAELYRNGENLNIMLPDHADLLCWARQGVLLLNTYLTLRTRKTPQEKTSGSHKEVWNSCVFGDVFEPLLDFTSLVLKRIAEKNPHVAFVAFGNEAVEACTVVRTMPGTVMRSWVTNDDEWLKHFFEIQNNELDAIIVGKQPQSISSHLLWCLSYGLSESLKRCGYRGKPCLIQPKVPEADRQRLVDECICLRSDKAWYGNDLEASKKKMEAIRKTALAVYWLKVLLDDPQGKTLNAVFVKCLPEALQQELERHGKKGVGGKITITTENFSEDLETHLVSLIEENPDICEGNRTGEEGAIAGRHLLLLGRHLAIGLTIPRWRQQVNAFLTSRLGNAAKVNWSIVSREEAEKNWAAFIVKRNADVERERVTRIQRVENEHFFFVINS